MIRLVVLAEREVEVDAVLDLVIGKDQAVIAVDLSHPFP